MDASSRPVVRAVETIVVPDKEHGQVVVLRDTQGVTTGHAVLPPALVPIVSRFTGDLTCAQIASAASVEIGQEVPVAVVVRLAEELDSALYLDGPRYRAAKHKVERDFAEGQVRPASHAGGAYYADRGKLTTYIDDACLAKANGAPAAAAHGRKMLALVAPHIDPWRGALGYGHAYGAMAAALPDEVETFVLFGTSHAPMREPFALCKKAFATPLGNVEADEAKIDALAAAASGFDPYADQFNHKREHSLEFQVVFLKHLMGGRPFKIVPVLAGLGAQQVSGSDPAGEARVARFMDGVRDVVAKGGGKVIVVAGADLAHVGPRFGDKAYGEAQRRKLEEKDRASLDRAVAGEAREFWDHVAADLETRRVCGLAPIWSLLTAVEGRGAEGKVLHYEQTLDEDDGSIVSHAAVGFYG
jgi:AmmeMemoRadiSam system protein B